MGLRTVTGTIFLLFCLGLAPAFAQAPAAPPSAADRKQELEAALGAAIKASTKGPAVVALGSQGRMALPAGYQFVPLAEAQRLMRAFGNRTGADFLGLVLPAGDSDGWIAIVDFVKAGYVKDDDARNWKSDELLQQLKDGTEQANEDRRQRGFPEIEVAGWVEPPAYEEGTHRLVWSALARTKGAPATEGASVNYNTYALGREGFYKLNLITGHDTIAADKQHAWKLLGALAYNDGKRYEDFNAATDHVAEYGLAALIAGVAAKKLGLLAVIGVALLKFWKLAALGFFGVAALVGKLFGRGKKTG
jgi:uncharacterized membrane-anchored protein